MHQKRADELNVIIKKLFKSFAVEGISNENFDSLLGEYEAEQKSLCWQIAEFEKRVAAFEESTADAEQFLVLAKKYTEFSESLSMTLKRLIEIKYRK